MIHERVAIPKIDSIVFDELGLSGDKDYIIEALNNIYYRRIKKSQTK